MTGCIAFASRYRFLLFPCVGAFVLLIITAGSTDTGSSRTLAQVQWPLGVTLHEGIALMMHVDNNPASNSISDYRCNDQYVYDGHRGTDLSAYNFRSMDDGIPVLAAADGVVSFTRYDQFDRNYWPPYVGDPNGIVIQHADGSNTQYWHLRKNSLAVNEGESVEAGQFIGYIGSSGATPIPHLHFEIWTPVNGQLAFRDPFEGPCNTQAILWTTPLAYPGDTTLRILDMDLFTDTTLQGTESNNYFGEHALKDRPLRPETLGTHEAQLGLWVQLQGSPSATYTVRILKPDGSVFGTQPKTVATKRGIQWHVFYWNFAGAVFAADLGGWTAQLEYEGRVIRETTFTVDETTTYAPRFYPVAGRSLRLDGTEHRATLRMSGQEGPVGFHLVNAPSFVTLTDDVVTVSATANPAYRNTHFQAVATDAAGRTDTMQFHLVAPGRPRRALSTAADPEPEAARFSLAQNYPNPFRGQTEIRFTLDETSLVSLTITDVQGRTVQTILTNARKEAGLHRMPFDGSGLSSGVYLYRLEARPIADTAQAATLTRAMTRIR